MALKAHSSEEDHSSPSMKYTRSRSGSNPADGSGASDDGTMTTVTEEEITSIRNELSEGTSNFGSENSSPFILPDIEEDSDGEYDSDAEDDSTTHASTSSRMSQPFVQFAPSIPMEASSKYRQPGMPVLQEMEGSFAELGFNSVHVQNKPELIACVNSINVDAQRESPTMEKEPPQSVALASAPKRMNFTSILPGIMGGTNKGGSIASESDDQSVMSATTANTHVRRTRSLSVSKSREASASPTPIALNDGAENPGEDPRFLAAPTAANLAVLSENYISDPNKPPSIRSERSDADQSIKSISAPVRGARRKISISKILRPNQVQAAYDPEILSIINSVGEESYHSAQSNKSYLSNAHQSVMSASMISQSSHSHASYSQSGMSQQSSRVQPPRSDSYSSNSSQQRRAPATRAPLEPGVKPRKARLARLLLNNHVQADFDIEEEIANSKKASGSGSNHGGSGSGSYHGTTGNGSDHGPIGGGSYHGDVQPLEVELDHGGMDGSVSSKYSARSAQPPRGPPRGPPRSGGSPYGGPAYQQGGPPYPQYEHGGPPQQYPPQHYTPGGPPQQHHQQGPPYQQHGPPHQYMPHQQYSPHGGPPQQYPPQQQYPPESGPPPQQYQLQGGPAPQQYPPPQQQQYLPESGPLQPYPAQGPPQPYPLTPYQQGGPTQPYPPGPAMPPPSVSIHPPGASGQYPQTPVPMTPHPNQYLDMHQEPESPLTPQTQNEEYPTQYYHQQQPYPPGGPYQQPYQQGPPPQQYYQGGLPPPHRYPPGGPSPQHYPPGGPPQHYPPSGPPQHYPQSGPPHQYPQSEPPHQYPPGGPPQQSYQRGPQPQNYQGARPPPQQYRQQGPGHLTRESSGQMVRESSINSSQSGQSPNMAQGNRSNFAGDAHVTIATENGSAPEKKKGLKGLFGGKKLTAEEKREAQRMKYADYDL